MPLLPLLTSDEMMEPPIQQRGNYFIMDTEQLVSNPFTTMRKEAQNDFGNKKQSLTQKMTAVRNNICENHFRYTKDNLERSSTKLMQRLHNNTSKFRFEIKLLELDKRKHDVEIRKRIEPNRNYDYDDSQIVSSSRRLCANVHTPYLEKKMVHPVRVKCISEATVTPTVAKARESLKQKTLQREYDEFLTEISQRSRILSSSTTSKLRSARSAPILSNSKSPCKDTFTSFPSINKQSAKHTSQHVKFAFDNVNRAQRLKRTADVLDLNVSNTNRIYSYDSEDSEDDFVEYEKIDLRAIFFGKPAEQSKDDNMSERSHKQSFTSDLNHVKKPQEPITPEVLHRQYENVQKKVHTFIKDCSITVKRHQVYDSDEESSNGHMRNRIETDFRKEDDYKDEDKNDRTDEEKVVQLHKEAWEYIHGHNADSQLTGTYNTQDLVLQRLTGINIGKSNRSMVPLNSASRAMRKTATFKMRKVLEILKSNRTRYEEHEINELKKQNENEDEEVNSDNNIETKETTQKINQEVNESQIN